MTEASATRRASIALLTVLLLAAFGCSRRGVVYVPDGGTHTMVEVERSAEKTDISSAARVTVEGAVEARRKALVDLRKQGAEAGKAADLMTTGFPLDTRAVPVHVEAATVDGTSVWVIVEAWGSGTGKLAQRRLWVFERESGDLIGARSWK